MANQFRLCQNCKRDIADINYALHSAHCERNIHLCNLCNEPVPKSGRDQHIEEYHSIGECKLCNTLMEKWQMAKHEEICIKRLVDCKFCNLPIPHDALEEHIEMCGARTEKCPVCKDYVLLKDLDRHREICQNKDTSKTQGKCSYCHEIVSWIDMREHESYCYLSTCPSDDEDLLKNNVDHTHPTARKKVLQSDSRPRKRTEDKSTIHTMKRCEYCKERFPDLIMTFHLETCKERPFSCELCLMSFPLKDKNNHEQLICPMISGNDNCYAASGYTKSYEKKLKACPYCLKQFPELMFKDHQEACEESPYQCNLCLKAMPLKDKTKHSSKECIYKDKKRNQYSNILGSERGFSIDATNNQRQYDKKSKDCPYCFEKFPEMMYCLHLEACDEQPYKCSLCHEFIALKNKIYHDKNQCKSMDKIQKQFSSSDKVYLKDVASVRTKSVTKDAPVCSRQFEMESLEFNHESCPYCQNRIPAERIARHVQLCSENKTLCRFCGVTIPIGNEIVHFQNCIGARNVVEEPVYQATNEPEYQTAGNKRNRKNKKKNQNQTELPASKTSFFSNFLSWGKDLDPKKSYTHTIPQMVAPQFPQVVLLPCEFCDELFPEDLIIDHQSGCRPDLTSLPQSETSHHTKLQFSNVHEACENQNAKVLAQSLMKAKHNESTGAKPKRYQISRNSSEVSPGEYLPTKINSTKEPDSGHDYFNYPSGVPDHLYEKESKTNKQSGKFHQLKYEENHVSFVKPDCERDYFNYPSGVPDHLYKMETKASKPSEKFHQPQNEENDNQAVQENGTQKLSAKNSKISIFNFSASSNDFKSRSSANQATSPLPSVSRYDFHKDIYNSIRQGSSEDESTELKAVGAERAEKKGLFQISQDTSMESRGVYSEVSVNCNRSNQDSDAVCNEVYVEHDARNQLSPSFQFPTTCTDSEINENLYSAKKFNICFGKETSKVVQSDKVKSTCATRLLDRLENLDLHKAWGNDCTEDDAENSCATRLLGRCENLDLQENITEAWENDCTEDDAKNAETFGNNTHLEENTDSTHVEDISSDSGEHFFDAEDDFKMPTIEAYDSTSSSPNKDSSLDVYFQFLSKGKDELIGPNYMKNGGTPTPEVERSSVCECGNEICLCAVINQPSSLENNYSQNRTDNFQAAFAKGATPSMRLQRDLNTYDAYKTDNTNSQHGGRNILGKEGQLNSHDTEVEKRSATWNEWRLSKSTETDSD